MDLLGIAWGVGTLGRLISDDVTKKFARRFLCGCCRGRYHVHLVHDNSLVPLVVAVVIVVIASVLFMVVFVTLFEV